LNFNYYSNINNDIKEAALIGHQIAEEIAQFLQKSQINQFSKQEK
jgi:hypothetical protein